MASRPRSIKNRKLPPNLYPNGKYWRYRNPITGLMTSINRPLEDALKLARAANAKLAPVMAGDGKLLMILTGDRLTKHYQDGHTEKGIEYLEVGADLAF